MTFWRILLEAPSDTPYEGGVFLLYAHFTDQFPSVAAEIRFVTPIHHCNINSNGKICHSIFNRNYTQDTSIRMIFDLIYGLLQTPETNDPLDSSMTTDMYQNRAAYDAKARQMTQEHANKSMEAWLSETGIPVEVDHPAYLLDPIDGELLVDPVISTVSGTTYSRASIISKIQETGQDPANGVPLSVEQLVPNSSMIQALAEYSGNLSSPWFTN